MADNLHLTTEHESTTLWPKVAVDMVQEWATDGLGVPKDTAFYMVWFCFILGGWKALVSSTEADGRYYEVTHNEALNETYVDTYKKTHNHVIKPVD
jgi:hypothetical protein